MEKRCMVDRINATGGGEVTENNILREVNDPRQPMGPPKGPTMDPILGPQGQMLDPSGPSQLDAAWAQASSLPMGLMMPHQLRAHMQGTQTRNTHPRKGPKQRNSGLFYWADASSPTTYPHKTHPPLVHAHAHTRIRHLWARRCLTNSMPACKVHTRVTHTPRRTS